MATLPIRRNDETKTAPLAPMRETRWEPARLMRDLIGWDPFREMTPFTTTVPSEFVPSFEVKETKDAFIFKADVPGVKESDLEVSLTGNRLTLSGKREAEKQEQTDTYYTYERTYGDFSRAFTLPDGIDTSAVSADLKDGVLTVMVKKTPEMQPKKIAIQTPAKKS